MDTFYQSCLSDYFTGTTVWGRKLSVYDQVHVVNATAEQHTKGDPSTCHWNICNVTFRSTISLSWATLISRGIYNLSLDSVCLSESYPYYRTGYDYIVGFGLVEMTISANPKPTIYRNTVPVTCILCVEGRLRKQTKSYKFCRRRIVMSVF